MLVLMDMGYLSAAIPFKSLLTQGMVCHKSYKNSDGNWIYPEEIQKLDNGDLVDSEGKKIIECAFEKMSKSKKNIISPGKTIKSHGVDAIRLFIISDTPPEKDFDWNTDALDGTWRFLNRVWKVFNNVLTAIDKNIVADEALIKITHMYLKRITAAYEAILLNKVVALIRELFNAIESKVTSESAVALDFAFSTFIKVIYPITPYIAHEMWHIMKKSTQLQDELWPEIDEKLAEDEFVTMAVQVNGKLRGTFKIIKNMDEESATEEALKVTGIDKSLTKKIVVVQNRVVNIVL
jgi:leucyl-tRNA synthetase